MARVRRERPLALDLDRYGLGLAMALDLDRYGLGLAMAEALFYPAGLHRLLEFKFTGLRQFQWLAQRLVRAFHYFLPTSCVSPGRMPEGSSKVPGNLCPEVPGFT